MRRFVIRRLLLAIPTVFGICVVTFAMMHLAPGDPLDAQGGSGGPVPARVIEAQRRLYFLDLPLFYNAEPRGLARREGRVLDAVLAAGEAERARGLREARRCGTLCLDALAARLAVAGGEQRARLLAAVAAIRRDHPELSPGTRELAPWLVAARAMLTPPVIAAAVDRAGSDRVSWRVVARLGRAALPAVIDVVLEGQGTRRRLATEVASDLAGIEARIGPDLSEARALESWREWWYQQRREHVRFGGLQRLHGRLSETQFAKWLARILTLRFGHSIHDGRPVSAKLAEALPVTLLLSLLSMALAYLVAVPLGVYAAVRRGSLGERGLTVVTFLLYSMPSFWVAMMLILIFGGVGYLDWLPIYGLHTPGMEQATGWAWLSDRLLHLVLPVFCLTYGSVAVISRYQRGAMIDVLRQDYIRTARAKGLGERAVLWRHGLRNGLLPTITLLGLHLPYLIGGSVIVERIFNIPGMGLLTFEAFLNRDYPVVMAVSVLSALLTLAGLLVADLLYAVADPRIGVESAGRGV